MLTFSVPMCISVRHVVDFRALVLFFRMWRFFFNFLPVPVEWIGTAKRMIKNQLLRINLRFYFSRSQILLQNVGKSVIRGSVRVGELLQCSVYFGERRRTSIAQNFVAYCLLKNA